MNALQKLNRRIATAHIRTSAAIRAELGHYDEPQRHSALLVAASAARNSLAALTGEELKTTTAQVEGLDRDAEKFRKSHTKAFERHAELSDELTAVTRTERHEMVNGLYQAFITTEADDWADICQTFENALIYRAAKASAIDQIAAQTRTPLPQLAVGFPAFICHSDSVNVAGLAKRTERRNIYQAVIQRTAEILAKVNH
jgi:hypothetical protein